MDDGDLEGAFLRACIIGLLIWLVILPGVFLWQMFFSALAWFGY
jgi:hypothetical protein